MLRDLDAERLERRAYVGRELGAGEIEHPASLGS
jgi:hypothetical protein